MAENDVSKMKVADLKKELKVRGLRTTGNKDELVERLQSALIEGDVFDDTAISEDLLNEDVLNDDELDEEAYLNPSSTHDEDAILKSPQRSNSSKSPETPSTSTTSISQQKKVVLKRKLAPSLSSSEDPSSEITEPSSDATKVAKLSNDKVESTNGAKSTNGSIRDTTVVKLSELTMKERLELRAKKFGVAPPVDALKQARAERFGLTSNAQNSTATKTTTATADVAPNVEILKKRAERFGVSVSNVMVNIENKEKLLKRQERFGISTTKTTTTTTTSGTTKTDTSATAAKVSSGVANDYAEKAKLRAERFKTST